MKSLLALPHNANLSQGNYNLSLVIHYTALVGLAGHFLFIFLFAWLGVPQMAWLNLASCAIFGLSFWVNRRGQPHMAMLLGVFEVAAHAVLAVIFIGWDSGFHYYIVSLTPLIFYSQSWRLSTKLLLTGMLSGLYVSMYFHALLSPALVICDPAKLRAVGVVNILTMFIVFAALAYYYRLAATNAETALTQANLTLKQQAHRDALTQLANRHDLSERIEALVSAYRIRPETFCVILADVDNFKLLNDTYGHKVGDAVLVHAAALLRGCMRENDMVGRWGGEEFLALLPATRADGACHLAERMRRQIASAPFPADGRSIVVTMTFGVAEYEREIDAVTCIDRADRAMYDGKIRGKNCVRVHAEG